MKVYKVVSIENGKFCSAIADGAACVEYKPDKWAETPKWLAEKGYYLTAFRDLESARNFVFGDTEIWKAEAEGIIEELPPLLTFSKLRLRLFLREAFDWPFGTIMCQRIKLIKRVDKEILK